MIIFSEIQIVLNTIYSLLMVLVEPLAGKRDIIVTIFVWCMCVCMWSVQICPNHNLYSNAWISKQHGTVVSLEEECHLKHFYSPTLKKWGYTGFGLSVIP